MYLEPILFVFLAVGLLSLLPAIFLVLHSIAAATLDAVRVLRSKRR